MGDLISRQAILKNIEKIRQGVQMMDDTHRASIIMNGMYLCEKAVRNQPSAQSEIIRCKDCRYYKTYQYVNGIRKFLPRCSFNNIYVAEEDFCSQAERRKDG